MNLNPNVRGHDEPAAPAWNSEDFWPLAAAVARRWRWLAAAFTVGVLSGALVGRILWSTGYAAVAQIIRYETPDPQLFQPRPIAAPTLASMIDSTEVHARVGAAAVPPLSAGAVASALRIAPERNSDILNVELSGRDRATAIALANRYAEEAVRFTRQLQSREAEEAGRYLEQQLAKVEGEIAALNEKFRVLPPAALAGVARPRPTVLLTRLDEAREQLSDLLTRYTDAHPLVQAQRARVTALESQVAELAGRPAADGPAATSAPAAGSTDDGEILREVGKALESQRLQLASRLRLTRMLQDNPPGYYRIFAAATPERARINRPGARIGFLAFAGGLLGVFLAGAAAVAGELCDRRLKTAADVRRVTRLPLIARLGQLDRLTPEARSDWGFRTWTALQDSLGDSPNRGLVCGITSSRAGEGRSAWVRLLAEAATQCGFRVLTISTRPSAEGDLKRAEAPETRPGNPRAVGTEVATDVLGAPAEIARQLVNPDGPPHVHIPLPGWVWNLARRKEWLAALEHWRTLDNVVILVELPPASSPEAVLLAQNLPNVVWLVDGTLAGAPETREQLTTLRQARCNLVGAFLNREVALLSTDRFARWLPHVAAWLLLLAVPAGSLARPTVEEASGPPAAPTALSAVSVRQRAGWQNPFTLGPGDVLRLALFDDPTLTQPEVVVQPDGCISFLEARDVPVAGLSVDEVRTKLDAELANFRRAPRTMVAPVGFHSKKYFMLGKVARKGVYPLDRPVTVVEAVARAGGFETGLAGRNVVELVDLSRSFVVRQGRKLPVELERLFAEGDLAQNIPLEPGDYLYFPPADHREVHLLGELAAPGPVNFTGGLTVTRAIASRGGFTERAWRQRVLVLRGSLDRPRAIVVEVAEVLRGRQPDLPLEERDIVYVSPRPWVRAEDLLDDAVSAFAQSVVVFWTTDKVIPVVR